MTNWIISSGMVEVIFDEKIRETEKAVLIRVDKREYWLPKSACDFRDWSDIVEIPVNLAREKGLI